MTREAREMSGVDDIPYRDPSLPLDERVDDLLARMTLEEKIAQLGGLWITSLVSGARFNADAAAETLRHGIGHVTRIGASTGLRPEAIANLTNEIQRVAVERTRLGIPVVVHEESTGGFCARDATVFPQAIGLASTWDAPLVEEVAGVIRSQMLAVGARHALAPVLDVARDPRWGRVEETYGEDPVLAGALGVAYVRGLQGRDLRDGVVATGKHFLAYGLPEGGMNHAPVHVGPRQLREVFAEPFAAAVRDAGLASVMNSYSSVDGLPCAGAHAILTNLLREELGFDGVVVADYFSVGLLMSHHRIAGDRGAAAARAIAAGLDIELPAIDCYRELEAEVASGRVDVEVIDRAVRRALSVKFRLGLFEQPYVDARAAPARFQTPDQRALARRGAAESVVLLTNNGVLPLPPDVGTVAVIGPGADDERLLQGDYHYPAHVEIVYLGGLGTGNEPAAEEAEGGAAFLPEAGGAFSPGPYFTPHVTPLAGLREALGDARVTHAEGCGVSGDDRSGFDAAVAAARTADVAVVVVAGRSGLRPECTVGEARDAVDLRLTGVQEELVDAVTATGTPTVVVVLSGRVHTLERVARHAAALVQLWPPGEEGGHGLADVLTGATDASGRLPVSLPRHVGQVPVHSGHLSGGGRSMFYGDYVDSSAAPLFPFGHGLSYTTFAYDHLRVQATTTAETLAVSVAVTNTGARPGTETVQLYATDDVASVVRPYRQLVGFARVPLEPGAGCDITFTVHPSRLAFYDDDMRFVCEPGRVTFRVGASSSDLRATASTELSGEITQHRQREIVATTMTVNDPRR
jgi:beta-glucosidase